MKERKKDSGSEQGRYEKKSRQLELKATEYRDRDRQIER